MNLLWAMPLHVFVLPAFWKDRRWAFTYFKVNAIILLLTLVLWAWLPQQLNVFLIPVVVALMIRAAWIGWGERRISTL